MSPKLPGEALRDAVRLAKAQIPGAFTVGGGLPFSGGVVPVTGAPRWGGGEPLVEDTNLPRGGEDNILPTGDEEVRDLDEQRSQLGIEAIAFYVSFHRPTPDDAWGIFYFDGRVRQLARQLQTELVLSDPRRAAEIAMEVVRRHELFHFRFDVFALHQELTLQRPLYIEYSQQVYAKVLCTPECYEEALANRACVRSNWTPTPTTVGLPTSWQITQFLRRFCLDSPPGYRDFDRPERELKARLGGQLLGTCSPVGLPEPQARWVGNAGPFERRACCPEFHLSDKRPTPRGGVQLRKKTGKHIWDFHRYDPDPWPSRPHGHDVETGHKLSLANGMIYDPRRRRDGGPVGHENPGTVRELRKYLVEKWPGLAMDPPDPAIVSAAEPARA